MNVTSCVHCDQPIRLAFGTWIHIREDLLASKPFCLNGTTKATPQPESETAR